jgi:hypothetical protein
MRTNSRERENAFSSRLLTQPVVRIQNTCCILWIKNYRLASGLSIAEDTLSGGWVQPFGQGRQHPCNVMGRGFQSVQGCVAPGSERGAAGLTAKRLDLLGMTMLAITNQRVDLGIGDPAIRALRVGTSKALGVHALGGSSAAFDLAPGAYRPRHWLSTQRGSGGETTGRAIVWAARLE